MCVRACVRLCDVTELLHTHVIVIILTYLRTLILCNDGNVAILSQQWSTLPLIDEKYSIEH